MSHIYLTPNLRFCHFDLIGRYTDFSLKRHDKKA